MRKVIVIGCPGGGKSTFSRKLHDLTDLPLYHLDRMYWNPDRTKVEKSVFRERLAEVIEKDAWIIDGNYGSTMEWRIEASDTVFFLDYPTEVCLEGIRTRKDKPRSDMPWVETGDDEEFLQFIRDYREESRPKVLNLLEKYPDKTVFIFHARDEADEFLKNLK
ncbi:MAG: adenylate kinase [Clostridia bacterium]|nr:adenylate kinase [Clostridia bacterium]